MTSQTNKKTSPKGFSAEEKAAMKARALELKAEARASKDRAAGEKAIMDAIAALSESDRVMARRLHDIVTASAPELMPKTWYGMPAYANAEGKVVCFFTPASKFNTRYSTLGFNDVATLDDGDMWPTSFALIAVNEAEATRISQLVKRSVQ